MPDNIYIKPSDIMVNSYNDRIKAFSSRSKRAMSWVLEDNAKLGAVKAVVSIPGFNDRTVTVNRQNLTTLIPATSGDMVVIDLDDVTQTQSLIKSQKQLCKVFNITHAGDQRLYTKAFAHAVLIWAKYDVLITPEMFDVVELIGTQEALDYAESIPGTLIDLVEIKPILGALDYVGSIKVATTTSVVIETTPVVPTGPTVEPIWTVVGFEFNGMESIDSIPDPSFYESSTKTGVISSDREQINMETIVGWLDTAYCKIEDGERIRIALPDKVADKVVMLFLTPTTDINIFNDSSSITYPYSALISEADIESITNYVLIDKGYLSITTGQPTTTLSYNYTLAPGEKTYVEYSRIGDEITININGIYSYITSAAVGDTIVVPLVTSEYLNGMGSIESFTAEYITDSTDILVKPVWAMEPVDIPPPKNQM